MQIKTLLYTAAVASKLALGAELELFINDLDNVDVNAKLPLIKFEVDLKDNLLKTVEENLELNLQNFENPVCISAIINGNSDYHKNIPCFSYMKLMKDVPYQLNIEMYDADKDIINSLSFSKEEKIEYQENASTKETNEEPTEEATAGNLNIQAKIVYPRAGPQAPAIPLKKVTKTYKDKREAAANKASVQFGTTDAETAETDEDEEAPKSWFEQNWRTMVFGILAYNFYSALTRGNKRKEAEKKRD
ncbi:hypothetical protein TBLA_0I02100 [Henningerozyma blattae CBS 6284]|uniref:Uncharacterized protein n=1 Tax=Henningerozyma blattae (strain ATCC 34711 / CBS 6284 / DSM 70876 / NBRC 10599 / NRRL Y-10934 / UCD 77-7) TaxID=1071380 RepID=I2H916_HENB6|nr:hypothetical protein TBLA_0I02100 [Tetrapisispora blattae CBS 6284]CCH62868.1 hypothetical protein TBLA_0I02100 [Tetrapisispora blattae CBS 6284]